MLRLVDMPGAAEVDIRLGRSLGLVGNYPALLAGLVVLLALYVAAGKLGLALAFVNPSASAVWPPTGLALWAFLVLGPRAWPIILLGAFLVNVTTTGSVGTSLSIAVGNTLEGYLGALLVQHFAHGRSAFERPADVFRFALLAAGVATVVSATVGVTSLAVGGAARWADLGPIWLTWWLGDAVGALVVAPVLILWSNRPQPHWSPRRVFEAGVLLAAAVLLSLVIFVGWHPLPTKSYAIEFLAAPVLVWAALRLGPRTTATASLLIASIAIAGTVQGLGPFARADANESLILLQAFMGVLTVTSLVLAASVLERNQAEAVARAAEERLHLIAQRQRAEEALEAAQAIAHLGSWAWDIPTDTITWSDELYRIYGLDPQSFPATYESFLANVHPDDRARVDAIVQTAYGDHQPFDFYHRVVRLDGTTRIVHARGEVMVDAAGIPIRMVGTGHDVTESRQAEEEHAALIREQAARAQAEAILRERDEFLAVAAHELKTPLTSLLLTAEHAAQLLAADQPVDHDRMVRGVDRINAQSAKLARLISELLDFSQIAAGRLQLVRQPIDLAELVRHNVEEAQLQAGDRPIRVETPATVPAFVDALRLEQVLTNLLDNALKYSPTPAPIDVTLSVDLDDRGTVTVRDFGAGVAPEHRAHIFDRFYQGIVQQHSPGLGLGLYLSRQIVELHGGHLTAEFPPTGGSRFVIDLPLHSEPNEGGR